MKVIPLIFLVLVFFCQPEIFAQNQAGSVDVSGKDSLFYALCHSHGQLSSDEFFQFKGKLNRIIDEIKANKNFQKSEEHRIKLIYSKVHENLLNKYEFEALFSDLIRKGVYNCVTGSALYACVLDGLQVPYRIKLLPNHVFLVAYPDSKPIKVEVTTPNEGTVNYNESYRKNFVNYLVSYKLISKSEFTEKSVDQLFKENFDKDESISFEALIGVQCFNQALYSLDKENLSEAFINIEKAAKYYPCPKTKVMFNGIAAKLILEHRYKDPKEDLGLLIKMLQNDSSESLSNMVIDEYGIFTNRMQERGDLNGYSTSSEWFITQLNDSLVKAKISQIYYFEKARQHYLLSDFGAAINYAEKAYGLNPENANCEAILTESIARSLGKLSNVEKLADTLESYSIRHPKLLGNVAFISMLGSAYLYGSMMNFESGKVKTGEKYRQLFENMVKPGQSFNIEEQLIIQYYTSLCFQYYRVGQQGAAVKALQTDLKYVPNEPSLMRRLNSIR